MPWALYHQGWCGSKIQKKKQIINNYKLRLPLPIHQLDADGWALKEAVALIIPNYACAYLSMSRR